MALNLYNERFPKLVKFLQNAKAKRRVAHAYLITGDQEELLRDFARSWIQVCACESPGERYDACGNCENCRKLQNHTYPELFVLWPESKLRTIGVDDSRWLEQQLGMTGTGARLKVGLITEADCMTEQAQNAFLKTLEEPQPGNMLVLTTTRQRRLLPTIRSRCQTISIRENSRDYGDLVDAGLFDILAQIEPESGALRALTAASQLVELFGQLRQQAEEAHSGDEDERWEHVAEGDKNLQKKIEDQRNAQIEAEYRRLRERFLDAIQTWYLQQALLSRGVNREAIPHQEMLPYIFPCSPEAADRNVRLVDDLIYYLSGNTDERLAIEAFCLSVCEKSA